jgi:hypothetical protein
LVTTQKNKYFTIHSLKMLNIKLLILPVFILLLIIGLALYKKQSDDASLAEQQRLKKIQELQAVKDEAQALVTAKLNCVGYWKENTQECKTCPTGSILNGPGINTGFGSCNCSQINSYWDGINLKCINCPLNSVINGSGKPTGANNCNCTGSDMYWDPVNSVCSTCPANSSIYGAGPSVTPFNTVLGPCKCNDATIIWNGSSCTHCPPNSSVTGTGMGIGNGCNCNNKSLYWNGSSCVSCPGDSSTDGIGFPTNIPACKCNTLKHYWKPGLNLCDQCPLGSIPIGVLGGIGNPNGSGIVPGGPEWNTNLGWAPPYACACPWGSWPC